MAYKDKVRRQVYGKEMHYRHIGISAYTKAKNSALAGTIVAGGVVESAIVTGGQVLTITLTNGEWIRSGLFDAQRAGIIAGIDSAQAEAAGWDAQKATILPVSAVVRTNDTVVTITTAAAAAYAITANETITVIIPASAIDGQFEPLAAGSFVITHGS